MTDHVYEDTVRSYAFAERLANRQIQNSWEAIAGKIDTSGDGIPVVVFNTLGWPRTDVVEVTVGLSDSGVQGLAVRDATGRMLDAQVRNRLVMQTGI